MIRDVPALPPPRPATQDVPDLAVPPPMTDERPNNTPVFNPRLRLDAALNLVVIEFRTETGEVRDSIPSRRELDAYRRDRVSAEAPVTFDVRR